LKKRRHYSRTLVGGEWEACTRTTHQVALPAAAVGAAGEIEWKKTISHEKNRGNALDRNEQLFYRASFLYPLVLSMQRPVLVAILVVSLLVSGCITQKPMLPAGDPQELVTTIAKRGQGQGEQEPVQPDPWPESSVLGDCIRVGAIAALVCIALPVIVVFAAANHANSDSFSFPWSKDYVSLYK
jgi:hypothetical protein